MLCIDMYIKDILCIFSIYYLYTGYIFYKQNHLIRLQFFLYFINSVIPKFNPIRPLNVLFVSIHI